MTEESMIVPCLINGLGNRLFIYAAAYGTARRYNRKLVVLDTEIKACEHPTTTYEFFFGEPRSLQNVFYYLCDTSYFGEPIDNVNYIMKGYYISTLLWKDYAAELQEKWKCPSDREAALREKYNLDNSLFIHIRRGDFVGAHYELDLELYYKTCLSSFDKNSTVLVCSNDLEWCRNYELFRGSRFIFVDEDEITTLFLMSLCKLGGICANSTFSWWGAFLNSVAPDGSLFYPSEITQGALVYDSLFLDRTRMVVIDIFSGRKLKKFVDK